jgi:hypothetical protein
MHAQNDTIPCGLQRGEHLVSGGESDYRSRHADGACVLGPTSSSMGHEISCSLKNQCAGATGPMCVLRWRVRKPHGAPCLFPWSGPGGRGPPGATPLCVGAREGFRLIRFNLVDLDSSRSKRIRFYRWLLHFLAITFFSSAFDCEGKD